MYLANSCGFDFVLIVNALYDLKLMKLPKYKPDVIKRYWDGFLAVIYPQICLACDNTLMRGEEHVCTMCMYQLMRTNYHLKKDNPVAQLFYGRIDPVFATAYFGFDKGGIFQKLMHHLKYKDCSEIGHTLGEHAGLGLKQSPHLPPVAFVVPVPLHKKKLRKRGYNQSESIAEGIASKIGAKVDTEVLIRSKYASSQTKLSREMRWKNVSNNFTITNSERFEGKHVLLVDDVLTTGATLEACYMALVTIPDIRISISTLARAQ